MNTENIKEMIVHAHEKAFDKAMNEMPEIDVNLIINTFADLSAGRIELSDLKGEIAEIVTRSGAAYAKEMAESILQDTLKASDNESIQKLSTRKFVDQLFNSAVPAATSVKMYMEGKNDAAGLYEALGKSGIGDVAKTISNAFGYDLSTYKNAPEALLETAVPVLAYAASLEAFEMCMTALNGAHIAHEERVKIQKQCDENIQMIRRYRKEMEDAVEQYLGKYMSAFQESISLIDRSAIDNDPDGYILGNVQIAALMGHDVQFSNQSEFDALMDSDEPLKL